MPPRFGRGAPSHVSKTSQPRSGNLVAMLMHRMAPAAAPTNPFHPPPTTPHAIQQSNGRGERGNRHPYPGNTQQFTMQYIAGEFLLSRPGDMPLLSHMPRYNKILGPRGIVSTLWSEFVPGEMWTPFLRRFSNGV
jgi:hypothetical protein